MKRSDMLIKLSRFLEPYTPMKADTYAFADKILSLIEEKGMLPPKRMDVDTYKSYIHDDSIDYVDYVYDWEPEENSNE